MLIEHVSENHNGTYVRLFVSKCAENSLCETHFGQRVVRVERDEEGRVAVYL